MDTINEDNKLSRDSNKKKNIEQDQERIGSENLSRNVFLSRVFGLKTEDMSSSIREGEMSSFPIGSNSKDGLSLTTTDINDNERRIPESDPGTTTTGDEEDEYEDHMNINVNNNINGMLKGNPPGNSVSAWGGNNNFTNSNSNVNRYEFMYKRGQASSDESDNLNSSEANITDDNIHLAKDNKNKNNSYIPTDRTYTKHPDGSGRKASNASAAMRAKEVSLSHNQSLNQNNMVIESEDDASDYYGDEEEFLFAKAPKRTNKEHKNSQSSVLFKNLLPNMKSMNNSKKKTNLFTASNKTENQMHESRLNDKRGTKLNSLWGEDLATKFPIRRPNFGKNIKILNNTPQHKINTLSPKEISLWKWANVQNLDMFLQDIYKYYLDNGYYCIAIKKLLNLLTLIFVVYISTFMTFCINYPKFHESTTFSGVIIEQCYSKNITGFPKLLLWIFYVFVILKLIQFYFDIQNLSDIHNFYTYLLDIPDKELQTIPWKNIIQQIMYLKDQNALTANVVEVKAKNKLDPLIVANRIMRKDNFLIALYNQNILDLSLPIPMFRTNILTKTLEWNINLCVIGFAFNEEGFLKQQFLKSSQQAYLTEELKKRFMLAGVLNIILSPFLVTYFLLLYFFKYFNELKNSPARLGVRQYTPIAEWKFREFNELYHVFEKRLGLSTKLADKYINQFPKETLDIIFNFVSFVSGTFVTILVCLTLFDSEHFLNVEITKDRTAIFYITIFGAIWTICKNSISEEYNVFDPEETIKELSLYTHYLPEEWEGKYHTEGVKNEFCKLYNLRIIILLRELTSLILTPFVLWFSLPKCSQKIIEFISSSAIYIDGLGYVCKYASFDIKQFENQANESQQDTNNINTNSRHVRDTAINKNSVPIFDNLEEAIMDSDSDNDEVNGINKMMQSYMYFLNDYENSENLLGKHQISHRVFDETKNEDRVQYNTNYSWKKQFSPGQRPELFRIGKHAVRNPTSFSGPNRNNNNVRRKSSFSKRVPLTESFINSEVLTNPNLAQSYMLNSEADENMKNEGILKMVKDYYKTTNINS
ncbi:hypothetical protein TPHA_0J01690 [Tetrapisispora phaffii CBS 4417]|uniref:Autophagy-related protein 9 n=1 Tax=Tetrapisispora phaffii (strain ATCC 24235 / CBS 4417 / NBRC 1672 / NRRL Y-8282 / UCD 70-5) TaxID=1071381 RepID=G8BYP8_TETPH|nr:hypothetical protein TPHA_0J01690 [Tetrapisispora phaffii CBS 4417]CCE64990.1 hypothetical protein TPHA_0J01690 [Tetrapisispora phaffii CBS 4417]